jgi:hypothetical protein
MITFTITANRRFPSSFCSYVFKDLLFRCELQERMKEKMMQRKSTAAPTVERKSQSAGRVRPNNRSDVIR